MVSPFLCLSPSGRIILFDIAVLTQYFNKDVDIHDGHDHEWNRNIKYKISDVVTDLMLSKVFVFFIDVIASVVNPSKLNQR